MNPTDEGKLEDADRWALDHPEEAAAEERAMGDDWPLPTDTSGDPPWDTTDDGPTKLDNEPVLGGMEARADALAARVLRAKQEIGHPTDGEHDGGTWDPTMGLVCSCGEMLESFPETADHRESATTAAAAGSHVVEGLQPPQRFTSAVTPEDPILAMMDTIDPTQPYTPEQIEAHILDAVARLERGAHFERLCVEEVYRLKLEWTLYEPQALEEAWGEGMPADVRKGQARKRRRDLWQQLCVAEMKLDAVKTTMHSLRSVISGYQTVSRSVTTAYGAGNGTGR